MCGILLPVVAAIVSGLCLSDSGVGLWSGRRGCVAYCYRWCSVSYPPCPFRYSVKAAIVSGLCLSDSGVGLWSGMDVVWHTVTGGVRFLIRLVRSGILLRQPLCPDCVCPIAVLACGPGSTWLCGILLPVVAAIVSGLCLSDSGVGLWSVMDVVWHTVTGGVRFLIRLVRSGILLRQPLCPDCVCPIAVLGCGP